MHRCIGWGLERCNNIVGDNLVYCPVCEDKKSKIEKRIIEDGIEEGCFEDEEEITCPYCGHKDRDILETPEEDDEFECVSCGNIFQMVRNISVTYSTYKIQREE